MPRRTFRIPLDLATVRETFGFTAEEFPDTASSEVLSAKLQSAIDMAQARRAARRIANAVPGGRDDAYDPAWLTTQERASINAAYNGRWDGPAPGEIVREG